MSADLTHPTLAQCVDAARGTLDPRDRTAFDRHVEACETCAETVRFWHTVANVAIRDEDYEPSADPLDAVRTFIAGRQPARPGVVARATERLQALVATLTFDTLQQALPAGVRGGASGARQLLYEAPPLSVDLRLETGGRSQRILLAGQIVNAHCRSEGGQGAHVAVGGPSEEVTAAVANQFGEFQCEFDRREDLILSISLRDGGAIVIPLDRLPVSGYLDVTADTARKATT